MVWASQHLLPVPKVSAKRMDEHGLTSYEDVVPGLDVAIPEHLARPYPSPRSAEKACKFGSKWKVQPYDQVGSARDEITNLTFARAVDDPPGLPFKRSVNAPADLFDRRLVPITLVLDRIDLDECATDESRQLLSQRCLARPAPSDKRDPFNRVEQADHEEV